MTDDQIARRESAIASYIQKFAQQIKKEGYSVDINPEEASKSIVMLYERYAENIVRPAILSSSATIHHFKIISNTELSVLRVSPIVHEDKRAEKILNARLAFSIGLGFLIEWNELQEDKIAIILSEDKDMVEFIKEHYTWLCLVDTRSEFPIFCNAQVWRLFYYCISDRLKS